LLLASTAQKSQSLAGIVGDGVPMVILVLSEHSPMHGVFLCMHE
jgi:hypothetical protein